MSRPKIIEHAPLKKRFDTQTIASKQVLLGNIAKTSEGRCQAFKALIISYANTYVDTDLEDIVITFIEELFDCLPDNLKLDKDFILNVCRASSEQEQ